MGALRNKRREAFAQFVAGSVDKPRCLKRAYEAAGYLGQDHVAYVGGSRLMSFGEVKNRVAELSEPAIEDTGLSVERLLIEIETTLRDARADRAHSACIGALSLVLRVHELIAQGKATEGQFEGGAASAAEIVQMWIENAGGPRRAIEMAGHIIDAAQEQLAEQAILVD